MLAFLDFPSLVPGLVFLGPRQDRQRSLGIMVGLSWPQLAACALSLWAATGALASPSLARDPSSLYHTFDNHHGGSHAEFKCDLSAPLDPAADGLPTAGDILSGDAALKLQVYRHAEVVKVPSVSYDDNGEPGEDSRWEVFHKLHDVLEKLYPKFHARAKKETVNTFGLVFTLKGTDSSLKPLMLTAHQDVVPVADASTWKYPPFSAHFDGRWLWGRGAADDKNSLTALFSALETLLDQPGWKPRRDIVLALGFDEECSGKRGAAYISKFLLERYGRDSMAFLLDEGGLGLRAIGDVLYALPSVMEKGHVDIFFDLTIAGGHSSMPFPHTGIGVMSRIVSILESHPYTPHIVPQGPVHNHMVCQARYSPAFDEDVTRLVRKAAAAAAARDDGGAAAALAELARVLVNKDRATQYSITTSQSVDTFHGGVKINAMPERVIVGVNHRIAPHDSVDVVKENILRRIRPVVRDFGITLRAFEGEHGTEDLLARIATDDDSSEADGYGYAGAEISQRPPVDAMYEVDYNATLVLSTSQNTHVAPVSPSTLDDDVWNVFAGTIRHSFAFDNGTVVPVGEIMTGNTDTRHYLDLTRHVYRWVPTRDGARAGAHTVDEGIDMLSHMETVQFYYDLVRNFDAATDVARVAAGSVKEDGRHHEQDVGGMGEL
ncbi:hypothetical protein Micbo1qcDRAFT_161797 [Microdochium bolleyi]|uniref:Peptidase M20 dimerisation domain-containing protein n=1 Tax=Microdochium bolleyi TaxID=196109 RepID=A0A136J495_9PEZI|nr:hypothetical protein Micbo1qcDRAFT_161797 [Microdochium bolleyi]